jgi:ABC-type Fe3+-siderophore transport system permease subunit
MKLAKQPPLSPSSIILKKISQKFVCSAFVNFVDVLADALVIFDVSPNALFYKLEYHTLHVVIR